MKYKNSFFKIDIKDDGTYMDIFPRVSDGAELTAKEIFDFLEGKGITEYSADAIKGALSRLASEPVRVKISDARAEEFGESAVITVSEDKMTAYIRFYPPSANGKLMDKREILAELEREKIVHGISSRIIDVFLAARQYCLTIPIAKGDKPVMARDTVIKYSFDTKPLAKPKVLDDGSVDFHELNLFTPVHKGDVLATLTPHDMGAPGRNVYGQEVYQNKPKISRLKFGRNISLSEDGTTITSNVDGNVSFTDGTVFVSDTYNVAADVDNSTGDIDYEGNVVIAGTVKTGFTVKASGNIQVNGVVEGATLIAGGSIVIKRGVQGMNRGNLTAGGDICAQFLESANVTARGDVTAGSILQSRVISGGKVTVRGKKSFIIGGEVFCESSVEVNTIGNKMETQTLIKVGVKPELHEELKGLAAELKDLNVSADEISSYLNVFKEKLKKGAKLTPANIKQIKEYNARLKELEAVRAEKNSRISVIRSELDKGKKGFVRVSGDAHRGVIIYISTHSYAVKAKDVHCLYKIADGEIKPTAF